jgi:hypothetical protein
VYADTIIIDAYEHRTLLNFETFFNISVWFACFLPGQPNTCQLFLNRSLSPGCPSPNGAVRQNCRAAAAHTGCG